MKAVWPAIPFCLALLGCQGAAPNESAADELALMSEEPVSISVSVGGVT